METVAQMPPPARTVDTSGRLCPYPIVEAAKAVKALEPGAVLLVISTDPGIAIDMPMWCKATRNEHLGTFRDGAVWKSFVRTRGAGSAGGADTSRAGSAGGADTSRAGSAGGADTSRAGSAGGAEGGQPR